MILKKYKFLLSFLSLGITSEEADAQDFLDAHNIKENYLGKYFITNNGLGIDSSRTIEGGQLVHLPKGTKIFFESEEVREEFGENRIIFNVKYTVPGMEEDSVQCRPEQAQELSQKCLKITEELHRRIGTRVGETLKKAA